MPETDVTDATKRFRGRSVVSANDLSKADILAVLAQAERFAEWSGSSGAHWTPIEPRLAGRVLGLLFYEPSTRTRLSFESAMLRLGGAILGFADPQVSSLSKGESLSDTIRVVGGYCDAIVLRHPQEGAARLAAEVSDIPIINGGDGSNQHPTQTLLDLYTIRKAMGSLSGLRVGFMGDLRYGRAVHSLATALLHFDTTQVFIAPPGLRLPSELRTTIEAAGHYGGEVDNLADAGDLDVLYITRIQKERFPDPIEYDRLRNAYRVDRASLERFGPDLKILHPLPRVNEVDPDVDTLPGALYFQQTRNGVMARMALLDMILGSTL
jgi:aspartate carbamoyltransferase catalytic subunit